MKCPNCTEQNLVIAERRGIEIDYCPICRGIWLDRGELDKILDRSGGNEDSDRLPSYRAQSHQSDPYHKPYKKRKSLLEELFD